MVGVLLCDQSAAFDLCDHAILIEKLRLMGVGDAAALWFSSYLSGRRQSCMVDGQLSVPLEIPQCGVPQGSIGGPIMWLIFTCDQPDVVHKHPIDIKYFDRGCSVSDRQSGDNCGILVGYVDDGAYSFAHNNPVVLSTVLSETYAKLAEWMNANKLVINADKTHLLVMGSRKHNSQRKDIQLVAGGHIVQPSESEKLLGCHLHQSLDWRLHLHDHEPSLLNQLIRRINGLKKICINADFQTRLTVANGVVISKLSYLITLWGGAKQYLMNMLQVQQMTAARLVCGFGSWRLSRRKLLNRVGWLSVKQLIFYHTVLQVHKTLGNGLPLSLYNDLYNDYARSTRNAEVGNLRQVKRCRSTFQYRAVQFYNSVPADIRKGTVDTVKHKMKK